jgi:hypothetical protein
VTYWVHIEADGKPWCDASLFTPPRPAATPGKGYAEFHVEVEGFIFYFASLDELNLCIQTLGQRVLPSTLRETIRRGVRIGIGPNQHWLSRLPARLLPWQRKQRVVGYLKRSLAAFKVELKFPT